MIQIGIIGDGEAAREASRKGFVVLGVEPELEGEVRLAGGTFVLFGKKRSRITVACSDVVDAISRMVESSDVVIIGGGKFSRLAREICSTRGKPFFEGSGKEAVDQAREKLVKFNLFGSK